ncbi:MAG: hypothetical protein PVSMB3_18890 [Candidatus Dormibacteraceae bacterium]
MLSLLERKALWFPAVSQLEDRFEGAYTARDMRRRQQLAALTTRTPGSPRELVPIHIGETLVSGSPLTGPDFVRVLAYVRVQLEEIDAG